MKVHNVHERIFPPGDSPGRLIDTLGSENDALWPKRSWPAIRFDRPLQTRASGGHGPIRYYVESYDPGKSIRFRFTRPAGFDGTHAFQVTNHSNGTQILRHELEMTTRGPATLSWLLVYRPLHDALIEDALTIAEASFAHPPHHRPWSIRVRLLRHILSPRAKELRKK
jgi:hypothetical protein